MNKKDINGEKKGFTRSFINACVPFLFLSSFVQAHFYLYLLFHYCCSTIWEYSVNINWKLFSNAHHQVGEYTCISAHHRKQLEYKSLRRNFPVGIVELTLPFQMYFWRCFVCHFYMCAQLLNCIFVVFVRDIGKTSANQTSREPNEKVQAKKQDSMPLIISQRTLTHQITQSYSNLCVMRIVFCACRSKAHRYNSIKSNFKLPKRRFSFNTQRESQRWDMSSGRESIDFSLHLPNIPIVILAGIRMI